MAKSKTKQVETPSNAKAAPAAGEKASALRPSQCKAHMRRRLASEFPGIVDGFVKQARSGSCAHVKLATELVAEPNKVQRKKSAAERMLDELRGKPVHVRHGRGLDGKFTTGV